MCVPDATPGFIESIKEDPTCQYVLVFSTSLLCGHAAFSPSAPAVHHIRCLADGLTAGELAQSRSAEAAVLEGAQPGGVGLAGGEGAGGGAATGAAQAAAATTAEGKPRCCRQACMLRCPDPLPAAFACAHPFSLPAAYENSWWKTWMGIFGCLTPSGRKAGLRMHPMRMTMMMTMRSLFRRRA